MQTSISISLRTSIAPKSIANDVENKTGKMRFHLYFGFMLALCQLLSACSTPQPPVSKAVYDFGVVHTASTVAASEMPSRPALALPDIEAGNGLESPAMLYRLLYADAQQLRPYAQARWSVPPAQLVHARLRDALARSGPVLMNEGLASWTLRIELLEFSQIFSDPNSSYGLVRMRLSLFKTNTSQGERLVAQTTVLSRAASNSQDAAGGVRALTAATDDAVQQIDRWLSAQIKP